MEIVNVQEYEAVAKEKLPKMVYDYYASGAEDQWTLEENRRAFQRIRFRPRILVDVSKIDTSSTVLGFKISMPIMIAPSAMQKMAHPDGELATARAASAAGTIMDIKWLQTITHLPILLKGVLTAEDTRLAVQAGVAGIIVSNHGARQLDYVPATISCLEEVVNAAQGQVPVYLDGGVRRGTDVFKALALGASGVFIGRPVLFALAAEGEAGVRKVLQMLRDEFELTMSLIGCCSVKDIKRNYIRTEADMFRALARL